MGVQFLDLTRQYATIRDEVTRTIRDLCETQRFILGRHVSELENQLAAFCGVDHCVGVSSGTDALLVAMMALGVGTGDEVIVPSFTFVATANTVSRLGARVIFADIEPNTFNIDPDSVLRLITPRTKGVIAVHLFGQCANLTLLQRIAGEKGLWLLEDCAQAIGAEHAGKVAGNVGIAGCFSFYPTKNLGCFGDGGMITTNDANLANKMRLIRAHGGRVRYEYEEIGGCFRLDELQAAILSVKLPHLRDWTEARRRIASVYETLFSNDRLHDRYSLGLPYIVPDNRHVFNQYVLRVPRRDAIRHYLTEVGIGTEVYYPLPLHLQACFRNIGLGGGALPESEKASNEVLALPCYPELALSEQQQVVEAIAGFLKIEYGRAK